MKITLKHDKNGPQIVHADTGQLVHGVRRVNYEANAHAAGIRATLTVDLIPHEVGVDGGKDGAKIEWRFTHPVTGETKPLRSVTFADGEVWEVEP